MNVKVAELSVRSTALKSPYKWVWVGLALLYCLMLLLTPGQVSGRALAGASPYIGMLAMAAMGQALVIMQRGIDFSVVGVMLLSGMTVGTLAAGPLGPGGAVLATLAVGAFAGVFNGAIVVYLRVTPLVATLASNGIFIGLALILSGGAPIIVAEPLHGLARSRLFGLSSVLLIAIVLCCALAWVLRGTLFGRRYTAVGANPRAARAAGIPVDRYLLITYSLAGVLFACAGIFLASHIGDSRMTSGADYLMGSVAAVVIGGTPLTGGRGSLFGTFGGAVFITLLAQLVLGLGAPNSTQLLVQGSVLLAAVSLPSAIGRIKSMKWPYATPSGARVAPGLSSGADTGE